MEQRTIGKFITALRKASGMTQRDLAERLGVSDKSVSRWERDEGAPDLSLIPVLAEIFGVTCDELLRGERRPPEERAAVSEEGSTLRGEKQRRRLVKAALSQYRSRVYIAAGLSLLGLIAAMIANLAFLQAILGFFLGTAFYVASAICLAIFVNRAFLSVEDAGLEEGELSQFKRQVIASARRSLGLTVTLLGFTAPLLLAGAYTGLGTEATLLLGTVCAAVFLLVYAIVWHFLTPALLRRGVYTLEAQEEAAYRHNRRLLRRCTAVLTALLLVTLLSHQAVTVIWGPWTIMEGEVFHDYDSFAACMERDIPHPDGPRGVQAVAPESVEHSYDESGQEISQEEAFRQTLEDGEGNVVCTYIKRNDSVISIQYSENEDGTLLPITVYTQDDYDRAVKKAHRRHVLFAVLCCAEIAAVAAAYRKKRVG